jgi:hypothetical protein
MSQAIFDVRKMMNEAMLGLGKVRLGGARHVKESNQDKKN